MDTKNILQIIQDNDTFLISWYAKKYSKIITRRGTWTKPNTDTQGRHFVSMFPRSIPDPRNYS